MLDGIKKWFRTTFTKDISASVRALGKSIAKEDEWNITRTYNDYGNTFVRLVHVRHRLTLNISHVQDGIYDVWAVDESWMTPDEKDYILDIYLKIEDRIVARQKEDNNLIREQQAVEQRKKFAVLLEEANS